MNTLIVYDASASATLVTNVLHQHPDALLAVWDRGKVAANELSVPNELAARLLPIRDELAAWTYETAYVPIGGQTLEARLRCGDTLSMWWLSTLVEKHPKVTHNLFEALKARALEQIITERTVNHLVLVSGNSALHSTLAAFCTATDRQYTHVKSNQYCTVKKLCTQWRTELRTWLRTKLGAEKVQRGTTQSTKGTQGTGIVSSGTGLGTASGTVRTSPGTELRTWLHTALRTTYYHLPAPIQGVARGIHWLYAVRRVLPTTSDLAPNAPGTSSIVTYFPNIDMNMAREGRFRSRYFENLHDALNEPANHAPNGQHKVNWLFIYFPSPQCTLSEAVKLRDGFARTGADGASFHFWEEFLSWSALGKALWRYARLIAASARVEWSVRRHFAFAGSSMNLWPLLKGNWAESTRGWRGLERCLMREAFKKYAAWCGPQSWTTFPQENCPWERMLAQSMHEAKAGPVYGAQHSTVRPTDFRYFDDPRIFSDPLCAPSMLDLWLCNGTGAQNSLKDAGMPSSRTELVEALRYLYLSPNASDSLSGKAEMEPAACHQLLLVTSFFADEVDAHLETLAEAVREGYLAGWDVRIKAHPYLPVESRLVKLFPVSGDYASQRPTVVDQPVGALLVPGVVVWASNSTTVALEAAYRHLPVLVQAAENDADLCPLQGLPGVTMVRSGTDVGAALAHPQAPVLPPDFLALDPALPRWRKRLGLM